VNTKFANWLADQLSTADVEVSQERFNPN